MPSIDEAIGEQFRVMNSIDDIVKQWVEDGDESDDPLHGRDLARKLFEWNEGVHNVRWIHKKAYESMRVHVLSPLVSDMNEGLGIERDHRD